MTTQRHVIPDPDALVRTVAAKMMGFDPLTIPYIRLAHEAGLGIGDPREIEYRKHGALGASRPAGASA